MSMMMSLYDLTVSGSTPHHIPVKANEAVWIPPECVALATSLGMVEVSGAAPKVVAAPDKTDDNVKDEFIVELDQAVLLLIARNDELDFKTDGTPKVARVIAEMDPKCRRATASEVATVFERLKDRVNLTE